MDKYDALTPPAPEEWLQLDEAEQQLLVEDYHHGLADELPSLQMHVLAHMIAETQVAMGSSTRAAATVERLLGEGLDRHDAIHAVGSVVMSLIAELMQEPPSGRDVKADLDERLDELTATSWLKGESD